MLKVERLSKTIDDFSINDISFEVHEGEYFVLLGASGVGKTVLLETIAGIIPADSGNIFLNNRNITNDKIQKRGIGLVYQDQALFPHLSVWQNIAYGIKSDKKKIKNQQIDRLSKELDIAHLLDRKTDTLSGGEAQRVALARTLATQPECLLLDEPISSLDTGARSDMRGLLRKLNRKNITMVHVTHDYEEAISLASRIGIMEHGKIVQIDTPQNIFHHPESEFVADFVGIKNFFRGRIINRYSDSDNSADFESNGLQFLILTDSNETAGNILMRSEDISISVEPFSSSIRNTFEGTIVDVFSVRFGVEVVVDIGVEVAALITHKSIDKLNLSCGKKVFVNIKASAIKFLGITNGS
jgi:molybdopterin-binding protein